MLCSLLALLQIVVATVITIYIYTPWIGFESELVNHKAERLVGEELKNAYAKSDFET